MPNFLKSENNVPRQNIDMLDGSWAERVAAAIVSSNAFEAYVTQDNCLRVMQDGTTLLTDQFDTFDTTTKWTATSGSGGSSGVASSVLTVQSGTTALAYSAVRTQPTFSSSGISFLGTAAQITFPVVSLANTKRFYGRATVPATPTIAAPVTSGIGIEIDEGGNFSAVHYNGGALVSSQSLSKLTPTNNVPFYVFIMERPDRFDIFINQSRTPDATFYFPVLDSFALSSVFLAVNGASGPASSGIIRGAAFAVVDFGNNAQSIKDPVNPFLQAAVTKPSTAVTAAQSAMAVALHPTSPLPAGSNQIGAVYSNNSEVRLQAQFTRPADTTAYAAGDLVANSTTVGSVVPLTFTNAIRSAGDCVRIERVRIEKSSTSLTNATFRLHLFEVSPTVTVGDNGVYNNAGVLATNAVLNHAGTFPVTMLWSGSDGAMGIGVPLTGSGATVSPTSGTSIFGLLEVTGAYTPVSGEVFYIVLEGYRT